MGLSLSSFGLGSLPFVGPTIAALSSIGGGLMAAEGAEDERHLQEQMHRENAALQREFAQHGVRWRVEDAKAAGLHPLYAIGASGASYSPQAFVGGTSPEEHIGRSLSEAGQNLSRAVSAQETAQQRLIGAAQLKLLEAQAEKEFAMASYYASESARRMQGAVSSAPMPGSAVVKVNPIRGPGNIESHPLFEGGIELKADPQASRSPLRSSEGASQNPFWRRYQISDDGATVILPFSEEGPAEAMESVPFWMWPYVFYRNYEHWQQNRARSFRQAPSRGDRGQSPVFISP